MDELLEKIIKEKACVGCDFRNDEQMKTVWWRLKKGRNTEFHKWNFEKSIFPEFIDGVIFIDCNLRETNFTNTQKFHNSVFNRCKMEKANFSGAIIDQGYISNSNCQDCDFENAHFYRKNDIINTDLTKAQFTSAKMDDITISNSNLSNTSFNNCHISRLQLSGNTKFANTEFINTKIGSIINNLDFYHKMRFRLCLFKSRIFRK
jgi:uncharacterized protein YjbI with pentapeptide repeats